MRNVVSICRTGIVFFCFLVMSCSRVPPVVNGFVSCTVANRIGSQVEWRHGCSQDDRTRAFIKCAVSNEFTADTAIQVALLNNPKIQALFEELGIAQADVVEAGLLTNPSFEIEVRYPPVPRLHTNIEYLIVSSLLDVFLIPLRTKLATTEFEQTKLRVSNEILNLAFDVRETYYELISEIQKTRFLEAQVELTNIKSEISFKQINVGNINNLVFQISQSQFLEAELELEKSQAEIIRLTEKLNRLLGFPHDFCLLLPSQLPSVECVGFDICALEHLAIHNRLDLQVARFEIMRISRMLGIKEWWTFTNLKGGLAGERDPDGTNLLGFGLSGQVPIFNYGQAAKMRLFAQLRQAQDRLGELEIRVLSEVREAHKLLMAYLSIHDNYQGRLLPMQEHILISSEELYNVMGLGVDQLLENKRQEAVAIQNYIESTKRYLMARVQLDRALGGYLFRLCVCGDGAIE
jgi:cobalt-zinc-cadmium efflux system outer membrane protein